MEMCVYDRAFEVPATVWCVECSKGLCSSCGYITDEGERMCNECYKVYFEDTKGECFLCGTELQPIMENNGFTEPFGPSHWEIVGYKPCVNCTGRGAYL